MTKKPIRWILTVLFLVVLLLLVCAFSLCAGLPGLSLTDIIPLILKGRGTPHYSILIDLRLPRIMLGFAIGGALSIAGVILQGMFRNSLVEPYTLGISGGAALGVALNSILKSTHGLGIYSLPVSGILGAFFVILFLRMLSTKRGILRIQGLLLTGVMINFVASSSVMLIMSISKAEDLHGILFWIIGSLGETEWLLVRIALFTALTGLVISYFFCFDLNALSLGEEEALHLGIDTEKTKRALFLLASILTGVCVSLAGAIGFVGLVVPHFVRMLVGVDHRIVLVCSFLSGATFLIFCDTIAKTIASPLELPVGVITGILGGVLFIYALSKRGVSMGRR